MGRTLLIVDDSPIARKILIRCLPPDETFRILEAGNGEIALKVYQAEKPDITFMDLTMPVVDGFQSIVDIRQFDPEAVIIVATADIQTKTLFRVLDAGALMVLKKPMSREGVKDALEKAEEVLKDSERKR